MRPSTAPSRPCQVPTSGVTAAAVGWLVLCAAVLPSAIAVAPLIGGAGHAAYFDNQRTDTISMVWKDPNPARVVTLEFWMKVMDPYVSYMGTFVYSVFDSVAAYEAANEYQIGVAPGYVRTWRATGREDCTVEQNPLCGTVMDGAWHHYAETIDEDSHIIRYLDGVVMDDRTPGGDFAKAIYGGGVIHLGQEPDAPWSDFDEFQSFHGYMDEVRVWGRVLSGAEIVAGMNSVADPTDADLQIYWRFDNDDPDGFVKDHSTHARTGLWGKLPTLLNTMKFATSKPTQPPTSPDHLPSYAPVFGSGYIDAYVAASGDTSVELFAFDSDTATLTTTITVLPGTGSLAQLDGTAISTVPTAVDDAARPQTKRVVYTPAPGVLASPEDSDTFTIEVDDGATTLSALVTVRPSILPTPPNITLSLVEDEAAFAVLGGINAETSNAPPVVITQLPERGSIFDVAFISASTYENINLDTAALEAAGLAITSAPHTVADVARSIIVYRPEPQESGVDYARLQYRYEDGGLASPYAYVHVHVTAANDPPAPLSSDVVASASGAETVVTLSSSDIDENFAASPLYRLATWPHMGTVYQLEDGAGEGGADARGDEIVEVDKVVTVFSWTQKVLNGSSQFSLCDQSCFTFQCDESLCTDTAWHASQIIGEPDVYPNYGDIKQGWDLGSENAGHEWIEVEFQEPMYITAMELYETYKVGAVQRVSTTPQWMGPATQWTTVWSGIPAPGPENAVVFSPPLCPETRYKTKHMRIDLDTAAVPGWNNYDALRVIGSLEHPPGRVSDPAGRFYYIPKAGVHGSDTAHFDSIEFHVTDCEAESNTPSRIGVNLTAPLEADRASASVWRSYGRTTSMGDDTELTLDSAEVLEDLAASLRQDLATFTADNPVTFFLPVSVADTGVQLYTSGPDGARGDLLTLPATLPAGATSLVAHAPLGARAAPLHVWVTAGEYTYRTLVDITMDCATSYFPLATTGECVLCADVPQAQIEAMDETQLLQLQAACPLCAPGTYRDQVLNDGTCTDCPLGQFRSSNDLQDSTCRPCPRGSYAPTRGLSRCISCDAAGGYAPAEGADSCHTCPANTVRSVGTPATNRTECTCLPGYWVRSGQRGQPCEPCGEGLVCDGGTVRPYPAAGYWGSTALGAAGTSHECSAPDDRCAGGRDFACGAGYADRLCQKCADGYYTAGSACLQCPGNRDAANAQTIFGALGILIVWVVVNKVSAGSYSTLDIALTFVQVTNLCQQFPLRYPSALRFLEDGGALLNFDIDILGYQCLTPWTLLHGFYLQLSLPLIVLLLYLALYGLGVLSLRKLPEGTNILGLPTTIQELDSWQADCVRGFSSFLVVVYNNLVLKSFGAFVCDDTGDGETFMNRADPAVTCGSSTHASMQAFASFGMLFYVIGIPAGLLGVLMYGQRHHLLSRAWFLDRFGWLYTRYETEFYYWDVTLLLRRFFVCILVVLMAGVPYLQALAACLVILVALSAQLSFLPFVNEGLDVLDAACLATTFFYVMCGMLFFAGVDFADELAVVLAIVTMVAVAGCVVSTIGDARSQHFSAAAVNKLMAVAKRYDEHLSAAGTPAHHVAMLKAKTTRVALSQLSSAPPGSSRAITPMAVATSNVNRADGSAELGGNASGKGAPVSAASARLAMLRHSLVDLVGEPSAWDKSFGGTSADMKRTIKDIRERGSVFRVRGAAKQLIMLVRFMPVALELQNTIRGRPLYLWSKQAGFDELQLFQCVNRTLSRIVADDSITSVYAQTELAEFYRRLTGAFPFLVDWLLIASDEERDAFRIIVSTLGRVFHQHGAGGRLAQLIVEQDRASVAFWLQDAPLVRRSMLLNLLRGVQAAKEGKRVEGRLRAVRDEFGFVTIQEPGQAALGSAEKKSDAASMRRVAGAHVAAAAAAAAVVARREGGGRGAASAASAVRETKDADFSPGARVGPGFTSVTVTPGRPEPRPTDPVPDVETLLVTRTPHRPNTLPPLGNGVPGATAAEGEGEADVGRG